MKIILLILGIFSLSLNLFGVQATVTEITEATESDFIRLNETNKKASLK